MAKQDSNRPAASLTRAGEKREETGLSGRPRPIRLLDPFDSWYRPHSLLAGISRGIVSGNLIRNRRASWSPALEPD